MNQHLEGAIWVLFVVIWSRFVVRAIRRPVRLGHAIALFWAAAWFVVALTWASPALAGDPLLARSVDLLVLALPYALLRVHADPSDVPGRWLRAVYALLVLSAVCVLVSAPPRPAWVSLALTAYFVVLSIATLIGLVGAFRREHPEIRDIKNALYDGTNGRVYRTREPDLLIKVWKHDPYSSEQYDTAREAASDRFRIFASLRFPEDGLACLPSRYLEVDGQPAYLMAKARGYSMDSEWKQFQALPFGHRLRLARSLADGFRKLHSRRVVHADIKLDNFFFEPAHGSVSILDLDGGGYYPSHDGVHHFAPTTVPQGVFMPPEFRRNVAVGLGESWFGVWDREERRLGPDQWGLAVLIYWMLTNEYPYPHDEFGPAGAWTDGPEWPTDRQANYLKQIGIDQEVVALFERVFCRASRTGQAAERPAAYAWSVTLTKAHERLMPASGSLQPISGRSRPPFAPVPARGLLVATIGLLIAVWVALLLGPPV